MVPFTTFYLLIISCEALAWRLRLDLTGTSKADDLPEWMLFEVFEKYCC